MFLCQRPCGLKVMTSKFKKGGLGMNSPCPEKWTRRCTRCDSNITQAGQCIRMSVGKYGNHLQTIIRAGPFVPGYRHMPDPAACF